MYASLNPTPEEIELEEEADKVKAAELWSHYKNDSPARCGKCLGECLPVGVVSDTHLMYVCGTCRTETDNPTHFSAYPFQGMHTMPKEGKDVNS